MSEWGMNVGSGIHNKGQQQSCMSQGRGQMVSEMILGSAIITYDATHVDQTQARGKAGCWQYGGWT